MEVRADRAFEPAANGERDGGLAIARAAPAGHDFDPAAARRGEFRDLFDRGARRFVRKLRKAVRRDRASAAAAEPAAVPVEAAAAPIAL